MVVKWSSEKDQFILTHILEDKNIKITTDVLDAMITAWRNPPHSTIEMPTNQSQPLPSALPPTRKAFTEHFSKIRKNSKVFTNGGASAPSTPATTIARKRKTPATKTPAKRRKANITSDSEPSDDEAPPTKTPAKRRKNVTADEDSDNDMKKEIAELGVKVKDEPVDEEESPSKKPARRGKESVQYAESDDGEVSHPEYADEYVDQEVVAAMSAYLETPDSEDDAEV
ncbi:unnamed protein product [Aureobasidium vineae]|uniref:Uncharacterized protein n=1 Tax=Aureobasidium vineae TaxID=2773715 RepID=A0A9N8JHN7_9PEZI|nr:unnamed protein product [Aureobasidium vineae]